MRQAAALLACAALALAPGLAPERAGALEADDVAWGCEDAGYVQPVQRDGGTAHRALVLLVHTDWGVLPASSELPEGQLYTGGSPECIDLDGDGLAEVVAAIAGPDGAWLTVYGKQTGPIVSTEPVAGGVSIIGGADMDGDGTAELAWIEDPEGKGRLRVANLRGGTLAEIASAGGFADRRPDGTSAAAVCRDEPDTLILPKADWSGLLRVRLADGGLISRQIAETTDEDAQVRAALADCPGTQNEEPK